MRVSAAIFLILFTATALGGFVHAQTSEDVEKRRAQLEAELADLEEKIEEQRAILQDKQKETASLQRDVAILDAEIEEAELSVRARNIAIDKIEAEIGQKEQTLGLLSSKMSREKDSLAQLVRKTNEIDSYSMAEMLLSNQDLSEFFADVDSFEAVKAGLQDSFVTIENTKRLTTAQKNALEEKRREEISLRQLQELQKQRVEERRAERKRILDITKGEEEAYQQVLDATRKSAAEIRSELFSLRGTDAIPFGEALDLAQRASEQTGVRPALILGVIREESNLGENVGNCNLPEDPPEYKWYNIMKAPRDTVPYQVIVESLGLTPDSMPLSCAPWYGYGGAMGPAQFIPSTWALFAGYDRDNGYQYNSSDDRIGKLTGNQPPNPWNPEDAFMASAVLLMDNGAAKGGYYNERLAALRYFAGWVNAEKPEYSFYADDIVGKYSGDPNGFATQYQKNIDILQGG